MSRNELNMYHEKGEFIMYEGIKSVLKLMNHICDSRNGCCGECPVFNECKKEHWEWLKDDLKNLGIEENEIDLPTN